MSKPEFNIQNWRSKFLKEELDSEQLTGYVNPADIEALTDLVDRIKGTLVSKGVSQEDATQYVLETVEHILLYK